MLPPKFVVHSVTGINAKKANICQTRLGPIRFSDVLEIFYDLSCKLRPIHIETTDTPQPSNAVTSHAVDQTCRPANDKCMHAQQEVHRCADAPHCQRFQAEQMSLVIPAGSLPLPASKFLSALLARAHFHL